MCVCLFLFTLLYVLHTLRILYFILFIYGMFYGHKLINHHIMRYIVFTAITALGQVKNPQPAWKCKTGPEKLSYAPQIL